MLTHVRIRNFKSWEDTGRIRLAPITVFFGTNSSGKSSIGQLILALKQTSESTDRTQVMRTSDVGTPVDVGSFRDFIHHHDTTRPLKFEIGWTQAAALEIEDSRDEAIRHSSTSLEFQVEIYQPETGREPMRVRRFEYSLGEAGEVDRFTVALEPDPKRSSRYRLAFNGFRPIHNPGRAWELPAPARFYGFPDEAVGYYQNTEFLPDFSLALERMLDAVTYLGPLRDDPRRVYTWLGGAPADVGWSGEQTVQAILAAADRKLNLGYRTRLKFFQVLLAEQLKRLGLIESFRVEPIGANRPEHEVRVRVSSAGDEVLLTDVGFGVSQVLPVLVQTFYCPPGSTILMEQPELHLHPKVQMNLADFFVDALSARQPTTPGKSEDRNTQFLIESHSEHFLRRLQRRIAEQHLRPDQVALYFCEVRRGRSVLRELDVDLFGDIRNWPEDFFGDPLDDLSAQAEASLKRRIAEAQQRPSDATQQRSSE
jgi:predicted ATPase